MSRVLITGGNGFIGSHISKYFASKGEPIRIASRRFQGHNASPNIEHHTINSLKEHVDWTDALCNIDVVIHCAGLAHTSEDLMQNSRNIFHEINTEGTLNLAHYAKNCGVKRFIFLSSIAVNGLCTAPNKSFIEDDPPAPQNLYAFSKLEAELGLLAISNTTDMGVTIIRPPLVYGLNAPGNFARLIKAIKYKIPLPLGAIQNLRSYIFVENLADFIYCASRNSKAINEIFLVSDGEDLSTADLINFISKAMGTKAIIFPVRYEFIKVLSQILKMHKFTNKLCGNLQINSSKARTLLNWTPPFSTKEGILKSVKL